MGNEGGWEGGSGHRCTLAQRVQSPLRPAPISLHLHLQQQQQQASLADLPCKRRSSVLCPIAHWARPCCATPPASSSKPGCCLCTCPLAADPLGWPAGPWAISPPAPYTARPGRPPPPPRWDCSSTGCSPRGTTAAVAPAAAAAAAAALAGTPGPLRERCMGRAAALGALLLTPCCGRPRISSGTTTRSWRLWC